jgi:hypothetical protein
MACTRSETAGTTEKRLRSARSLVRLLAPTFQLVCIQGMLDRFDIAFPEVERNFVERTLLPLFGFCEPEHSALGIMQRALSAKIFLAADFNELPVHELRSLVKPIAKQVTTLTLADSDRRVRCVLSHGAMLFFSGCEHRNATCLMRHNSVPGIQHSACEPRYLRYIAEFRFLEH